MVAMMKGLQELCAHPPEHLPAFDEAMSSLWRLIRPPNSDPKHAIFELASRVQSLPDLDNARLPSRSPMDDKANEATEGPIPSAATDNHTIRSDHPRDCAHRESR